MSGQTGLLSKKWGRPGTLLTTTSWQLIGGGIVLTPLALIIEGPPPESFTAAKVSGYLYLGIIGTAVAYTLWFRGIHLMPASTTAFLGLLSPLVATLCGWIVLHETLTPGQLAGAAIILVTLITTGASFGTGKNRTEPSALRATATGRRRFPCIRS